MGNTGWLAKRSRFRVKGMIGMLIGSFVIIATMLYLNSLKPEKPQEKEQRPLTFQVVKNVKTPKKPKPVPKKQPPLNKKPELAPPPALAGLGVEMSGIDFNMNAFDANSGLPQANDDLLGDTSNAVMTSDSVDQKPRPLKRAPLQYPARAKAKEIEGYVILSILVNKQGQVEQVRVLESEPQDTFEEVAIRNIKKWKFEPAKYKGDPVKIWINQPIKFDLG